MEKLFIQKLLGESEQQRSNNNNNNNNNVERHNNNNNNNNGKNKSIVSRTATFSYTAPQMSLDEFYLERKNLNQINKYQYDLDVKGFAPIIRETSYMIEQSIKEFYIELNNIDNKQAYIQATEKCPNIIELESYPLLFLRCEKFNPKAAAKRLVSYWEFRKKAFGERAFFAIDCLSGSEALTTEVIQYFHSGSAWILPNNDSFGRPIIYFIGFAVVAGNHNKKYVMPQIILYLFTIASRKVEAQRHGCVFIIDFDNFEIEHFDRKATKMMLKFLSDCAPVRVVAQHLCYPARKCVGSLFLPNALTMMSTYQRNHLRLHYERGGKDLVIALQVEGTLQSNCIPQSLGGTCKFNEFILWIEKQITKDRANLHSNPAA